MLEPIVYWTITILSIVMPVFSLAIIGSARRTTGLKWWLRVLTGVLLMGFCYQASVWAIYSIYLKYVFVAAAAGMVAWAWINRGPKATVARRGKVISLSLITLLFIANGLVLRGHVPPRVPPLELEFPLSGGRYYIIQGGNSPVSNFFHIRNRSQYYAIDIVKLNANGARANGIIPRDLSRYAIYGDTVYSPAEGVVIAAVDGQKESVPPTMIADLALGNGVILAIGDNRRLVLAHMKPGSVLVRNGQRVEVGEPLGQVGNSGRSAEPHLHIMAVRNAQPDNIFSGEPLPIRFEGRFLSLNDVFRN